MAQLAYPRADWSVGRGLPTDLGGRAVGLDFEDLNLQGEIVVENFRPGTMDRLGLGPEEMSDSKEEACP